MIRPAFFALRSTLPLAAASVVANGVRENFARLLGRECEVELLEPIAPNAEQRRILASGGFAWRVRGRRGDAFVIVRTADAMRLAGFAYGEPERPPAVPLSGLEDETIDRLLAALIPLCVSLCGTLGPATRSAGDVAAVEISSYFEVRTLGAPRIGIGFGLTVDPPEEPGKPLTLEDLADVELDGSVRFARGALELPRFARLAPGTIVSLETNLDAPAALSFGGIVVASGDPGSSGARRAFAVGA